MHVSDIMEKLKDAIRGREIRIVFPEGEDERVRTAAKRLAAEKLLEPVLIGKETTSGPLEGVRFLHPDTYPQTNELIQSLVERRAGKCTYEEASELIKYPNYFGTMLVHSGEADGLLSGAVHSTGDTVRPALQLIKTKPGVDKTFGYFLMIRKDEVYIMADCALNPCPDAKTLAAFGVESAKAAAMFGLEPKVAFLSFSTNRSAETDETKKVREAVKIAKKAAPGVAIDGEMQFDAAVCSDVAQKKYPDSDVAGRANTFIFPDLNAGNIGYKITQRLGGFEAIGPILAGLNKPLNDLSRGCCENDVYNTAIITAAQALVE